MAPKEFIALLALLICSWGCAVDVTLQFDATKVAQGEKTPRIEREDEMLLDVIPRGFTHNLLTS